MSCGAICEGVRVPAVTVFGWDDVLCPTTHARLERRPEPGKPGPIQGAIERREVRQESIRQQACAVRKDYNRPSCLGDMYSTPCTPCTLRLSFSDASWSQSSA